MNPSIDIAIADAVVTVLQAQAAQLPEDTIVERKLLPIYKPRDLETPRIAVAPRLHSREPKSRVSTDRQHVIQIAPHWQLTPSETEEQAESFLELMQTIADVIEVAGRSQLFAGATYLRMTSEPLYDSDLLASQNIFRGVWTLTFKQLATATLPS